MDPTLPIEPGHQLGEEERERIKIQAHHVLVVLIFTFAGGQIFLQRWKARNPLGYRKVCLIGLWTIPFYIGVHLGHWRFVLLTAIYAAATARTVSKVTCGMVGLFRVLCLGGGGARQVAPAVPRQTYRWFLLVYKVCLTCGGGGYLVLMLEMTGLRAALRLPARAVEWGGEALLLGLYFGLLGRDSAEVCADRLAAALGYAAPPPPLPAAAGRGAWPPPPSAAPRRPGGAGTCALCCEDLAPAGAVEGGAGYGGALDALDAAAAAGGAEGGGGGSGGEAVFRLECGHPFHEACIRGWALVGKKDSCPFCREKVALAAVLRGSPFLRQTRVWAQLLDAVRYVLVWNPLFLLLAQAVLRLWRA